MRGAQTTYTPPVYPQPKLSAARNPRRKRARLLLRSLLVAPLALGVVPIAVNGCESHDWPGCTAGEYCTCGNTPDCYLQCNANTCNLECSQTDSCGTICGDQCVATCHDTHDCSELCGNGCALDCHNVTTCAAQCGANCDYSCHDSQDCAVRVGPNSTVQCDHLTTCTVECEGACKVSCSNMNGDANCAVTCATGNVRTENGNGTYTCN